MLKAFNTKTKLLRKKVGQGNSDWKGTFVLLEEGDTKTAENVLCSCEGFTKLRFV